MLTDTHTAQQVDLLCNPAFPPLIPLSHAASAISHGLVRCFLLAAPAPRLNTCSQVVAMEMRQCEYRAVIPQRWLVAATRRFSARFSASFGAFSHQCCMSAYTYSWRALRHLLCLHSLATGRALSPAFRRCLTHFVCLPISLTVC